METLLSVLDSIGIPYAYDHFAEGESPEPPFLCYLLPGSSNFSADGKVYHRVSEVRLELYMDCKDFASEQKVGDALDAVGIFITSQRPGSTAKSCMRSCTLLIWRNVNAE